MTDTDIVSLDDYLRSLRERAAREPIPAPMSLDQYMTVLQQRCADFMAPRIEHAKGKPLQPYPALLEWFILPTDEQFVELPAPAPKRTPQPRHYRSSAELRAERDALIVRRDALMFDGPADRAAANVSTRARWNKLERDIAKVAQLSRRIQSLGFRISSAEARERRAH